MGGSANEVKKAVAAPSRSGSFWPSSRPARCSKIGSSRHQGPGSSAGAGTFVIRKPNRKTAAHPTPKAPGSYPAKIRAPAGLSGFPRLLAYDSLPPAIPRSAPGFLVAPPRARPAAEFAKTKSTDEL